MFIPRFIFIFLVIASFGCSSTSSNLRPSTDENDGPARSELFQFLEQIFERRLARSPQFQTYLGIKENYGQWNDISEQREVEDQELRIKDLATLRERFDPRKLEGQDRLNYQLFVYDTEQRISRFKWRFHSYPINQMGGYQSRIPAFLIGMHKVDSLSDAEAYIQRISGIKALFQQVEKSIRTREKLGVIAPAFVFPWAIEDCKNVLKGAPFEAGKDDSTLLADFRAKVEKLELESATKDDLIEKARKALLESVQPAYASLTRLLEEQAKKASSSHGVWSLPDGEAYYRNRLLLSTTLPLGPEEIHAIGLREVSAIHEEMRQIMKKVGFEGSLQEFFVHMRTDPRYYFANTPEGRREYLQSAEKVVEGIRARLDEIFVTKPKIPLEVRAVEPYREKSAGKAFYRGGAPDGSRPGIFYANLHNMMNMPKFELDALVYHEAIPGHHMQVAIAQRLDTLPRTRRFSWYTPYGEGRGLYSEHIPKEMGFYQDPYADFGRLALRLWRACRLVLDTGIHHMKWSREASIDYLMQNTAASEGQSLKAVERYFVMPGQATAYMIGMLKILELREKAREALGEGFDIRSYHELILTNGPMPLPILEQEVHLWMAPL